MGLNQGLEKLDCHIAPMLLAIRLTLAARRVRSQNISPGIGDLGAKYWESTILLINWCIMTLIVSMNPSRGRHHLQIHPVHRMH